MYPWIRLLRAGFTLAGKPRSAPLATTRVRLHVWPNDLDFNMHVNNGRYLTLADIGRIHWFMSTGVLQLTRQERAIPIVGDAIAKFRRELRLWQKFEIQTRMLGWDERWGFLEHRFVRDARVLGVVAVRGVFRGPNGNLYPGDLMSRLGVSETSPPLPEWIAQWDSGCNALSSLLRSEEAERGLR